MIVKGGTREAEPTSHGTFKHVLLRGGVLPAVTQVAVAEFDAHTEIPRHEHPTMYEVFYVLEGAGAYSLGDETHEAEPGDLVVVPPGTPHAVKATRAPHRVFYWGIATSPAGCVKYPDTQK